MPHAAHRSRTAGLVWLIFCLVCLPVLGLDPPDSAVNRKSGYIEVVDTPLVASKHNVRHTININIGGEDKTVFEVSGNSLDDLSPRLAISSSGDTWVVWWRDDTTDTVLVRKHTYSSSSWGSERTVSESNESSRNPKIIHDGTTPWVAFEFDDQGDTSIGVSSIVDDPDPIPTRTLLATTSYGGHLDVRIHAESSNLWVTWIDSSSNVGWSEYDYTAEGWSGPNYEFYETGEEDDAHSQIRTTVLGN